MIELAAPAAASAWTAAVTAKGTGHGVSAAAASRLQVSRLDVEQRELLPILEAPPFRAVVLYRMQRLLDGIAAEVDTAGVAALSRLPGVTSVRPLDVLRRGTWASVPLVGAPAAWEGAGAGVTGAGVTIGIIDSGIDYLHTDFGGPGTGYQANDPTAIGDVAGFPGARVVGGWDFCGDDYDASSSDPSQRVPHPDPDPMDCDGHGTFVAGVAAGSGVAADGSTFAGAYTGAIDFASLRVGPGVAPTASLYALRVFGCNPESSTSVVLQALEWAADPNGDGDLSDHLDIVNLSLGGWYGLTDAPTLVAADNAAKIGMVVVGIAGNEGDAYYITRDVGNAARVIDVAGSTSPGGVFNGFSVTDPPAIAGNYACTPATFGGDLATSGDVTAPLAYPASNHNGCAAYAGGSLAGRIAVIDRGTCDFVSKATNAQNAGALGVLVVNNQPGFPVTMGGTSASVTIPAVMTGRDAGQTIETQLASTGVSGKLTAALDGSIKLVDDGQTDVVYPPSSRGPRTGDSLLKPDLAAPAQLISSAAVGTGAGARSDTGTSFAAPHVAGAAALLRDLHPGWTVEEIKAALVGTADQEVYSGRDHGLPAEAPARVGAGRMDVAAAASTTLLAMSTSVPGAVGVSFGALEISGSRTFDRTVRVEDKSGAGATLALGFQAATTVPGVAVSMPGGTALAVPPGGSATFTVRLTANAAAMRHTHDPEVAETVSGLARPWISEASGLLTLTPPSGPALRLPVHAVVRAVSSMSATPHTLVVPGPAGTRALTLTGQGVNTGSSYPVDEISLVSASELQAESSHMGSSSASRQAADLRYVGVASDYAARIAAGQGLADTIVQFAIATWGDWSTPNQVRISIFVDADRNGTDDHVVYNAPAVTDTDLFAAEVCPLPAGQCNATFYYLDGLSPASYDTVPFNSDVMELPVEAGWLGLDDAHSRFDYHVVTQVTGATVDQTGTLTYDPVHSGLTFGDAELPLLFYDTPGNTVPVRCDVSALLANRSMGVLLLHHHNAREKRAEVVPISISPRELRRRILH